MNDKRYREFLEGEGITKTAISLRISEANRVEGEFNADLDRVVQNQTEMIKLRQRIYEKYGDKKSANLYNAVKRYYKCVNGIEMETITQLRTRKDKK
ncbi:MAG TPA: hypothetical protein DEF85_09460 [Clostridiaceae bacterium]|nr:hypothetical protein [Clostridiaceae bacterium]